MSYGTLRLRFRQALVAGLSQEFGETVGQILGEVIDYYPPTGMQPEQLEGMIEKDAEAIRRAVADQAVNGQTLALILSNTIASALLGRPEAVGQWAREGLNRCLQVREGGWPETLPEWQWMVDHGSETIELVRGLKRFLNEYYA